MKKYVRKVPCYSIAALVKRISDFLTSVSVTPERCSKYISHIKKDINEIILREGAWTDM